MYEIENLCMEAGKVGIVFIIVIGQTVMRVGVKDKVKGRTYLFYLFYFFVIIVG